MVSATLRAFCCRPVFELPLLKELDAHFHTIICDMDVPVHGHFQTGMAKELLQSLRACLISSNEDGNEGKRENLSRNKKFAFTIFPKSAEFVEPAK